MRHCGSAGIQRFAPWRRPGPRDRRSGNKRACDHISGEMDRVGQNGNVELAVAAWRRCPAPGRFGSCSSAGQHADARCVGPARSSPTDLSRRPGVRVGRGERGRVYSDRNLLFRHAKYPAYRATACRRWAAVSLGRRIPGCTRWERIWERNAAQPRRRGGTGRHGLDGRLAVTCAFEDRRETGTG